MFLTPSIAIPTNYQCRQSIERKTVLQLYLTTLPNVHCRRAASLKFHLINVSMASERTCPPSWLRVLKHNFHTKRGLTAERLARGLCISKSDISSDEAFAIVEKAVQDGLLVPSTKPNYFKLPEITTFLETSHDSYCYECHLPGELTNCEGCFRAFHRYCYRAKVDRPNYVQPTVKGNKRPALYLDTDSEIDPNPPTQQRDDVNEPVVTETAEPTQAPSGTLPSRDLKCSIDDGKPIVDGYSESKAEVIYVASVPPLLRQRHQTNNNAPKHEQMQENEAEDKFNEKDRCTACRLQRTASIYNPPNVGEDELSYLIYVTFENNRSWMDTDCIKYMTESSWSNDDIQLVKLLLFKCNEIGLDGISEKIRLKQYSFLIDYLIDLLDFQHNIGVFFGENSEEAEATKWMLRDIMHELNEIRRCPDCFRYSNEKLNFWFCRPCVQRHELVYAKLTGCPYWPAKVIRVLRKHDKYDVRFFGDAHSRGLIPSRNIKPIDVDLKSLKIKKTPGMKKALLELECFQALSRFSPLYFRYGADCAVVDSIIQRALSSYIVLEEDISDTSMAVVGSTTTPTPLTTSRKRGRPPSSAKRTGFCQPRVILTRVQMPNNENQSQISLGNGIGDVTGEEAAMTIQETRATATLARTTRSSTAASRLQINELNNLTHQLEIAKRDLEAANKIIKKQELAVARYKEQETQYELEKKRIKCQQWCSWCLEKATFLCCFNASYCSRECQQRHWRTHQRKDCMNKGTEHEPSSTTT